MKLLGIVLFVIASVSTAQAQQVSRVAVSGKPMNLGSFGAANPDCTSAGYPTVRVVEEPQHGRVIISKSRNFPVFGPFNMTHFHCSHQRIPSISVQYISQRGYLGPDSMTIEAIYNSGRYAKRTFSISVR